MMFRDEYEFLSNFYEIPVTYEGINYRNSEAAFQAAKCVGENLSYRPSFSRLSGGQAKRRGRQVPLRSDWEEVKDEVMKEILFCKFRQNPGVAQRLIETGSIELVEDNTWGDTYWGRCNGEGKNMLGKLLMEVRSVLSEELNSEEVSSLELDEMELELEDDGFDGDEFSLVPENLNESGEGSEFSMTLRLRGVLIDEELDEISSLCSDEESARSLPLFISLEDSSVNQFIGFLTLDLDTLLILHTLNPNYYLTLRDEETGKSSDLLSPEIESVGEVMSSFITLR